MAFLFGGGRPSGKDGIRDHQRRAASTARGMERELGRIDSQERALQGAIKKMAIDGKVDTATVKAKELVRLRAHRSRMQTMHAHLLGLSQHLQTVHNSTRIQDTLAETSRMMQSVNARFDAASISRMLQDFERQNVLLGAKQEIVEDTMESALEVDGEREAMDDAVLGVLQEAGLDLSSRLGPSRLAQGPEPPESLDERLQRLRGGEQ